LKPFRTSAGGGYIERVGSGTQAMIRLCREAGLPEPAYEVRHGFFVLTLWRNWLTAHVLAQLGLTERQLRVVEYARSAGRINNAMYRKLTAASERTASRELQQLGRLGVFVKVGGTGRATHYSLARTKPAMNPPNPPRGKP
jgi:ATP-dependent DNA helicase RecG